MGKENDNGSLRSPELVKSGQKIEPFTNGNIVSLLERGESSLTPISLEVTPAYKLMAKALESTHRIESKNLAALWVNDHSVDQRKEIGPCVDRGDIDLRNSSGSQKG